jgi:hypothetical protein
MTIIFNILNIMDFLPNSIIFLIFYFIKAIIIMAIIIIIIIIFAFLKYLIVIVIKFVSFIIITKVFLVINFISFEYPFIDLHVNFMDVEELNVIKILYYFIEVKFFNFIMIRALKFNLIIIQFIFIILDIITNN